jgi:hypothetical protein
MQFQVGQIVTTKSSGLRSRIIEIIDENTVKTDTGYRGRTMKVSALITNEEYTKLWEAREARRRKKFGRR